MRPTPLNSHELKCWYREARSAYLYLVLSDTEAGTPRQLVFLELANEAREQAALWANEARKSGMAAPEYIPNRWVSALVWLLQKLGAHAVKPLLGLMKLRGLAMFRPLLQRSLSQQDHAVFAFNEGLFAIALLVIGVASAEASHGVIILIGVAGLLAGAVATAAGEYFSGNGSVPTIPINPEHEELSRIYQARGMGQQEADTLATRVMTDPDAEDEEPVDVAEESAEVVAPIPVLPLQVAVRAFFAFVFGGAVPLAPYLFGLQRHSLLMALVLSGVCCMMTGAVMASLIKREPLWGAFRVLGAGMLAGLLSALVGGLAGSFI